MLRIVREYTREAGVRNLERELAGVLRKVARRVGEGSFSRSVWIGASIPDYLGPPRFFDEVAERIDRPGVATGLAWTPTGGEVLVRRGHDDARRRRACWSSPGMLGDVMRESAEAALRICARTRCASG